MRLARRDGDGSRIRHDDKRGDDLRLGRMKEEGGMAGVRLGAGRFGQGLGDCGGGLEPVRDVVVVVLVFAGGIRRGRRG